MPDQTDDFEMIREQARRYLDDAAAPEHLKSMLETPATFDHRLWQGAIDLGWPAAALPEQHDGLGLGWRGLCVLAEEIGRKSASLPLIASAALAQLLAAEGSAGQRSLTALATGEQHACLALVQDFAGPGGTVPRARRPRRRPGPKEAAG